LKISNVVPKNGNSENYQIAAKENSIYRY